MLRSIASKLWPKTVAPQLRSKVIKIRGKTAVRLHFEAWKRYSYLVYGEHRPISAHGAELIARSSDWRAYWVHKQGGSQRPLMRIWRELINLQPDLCIDVGANYGEFSASVVHNVNSLLAIEANPAVFACLRQTLADSDVIVCNNAASDESGTVTIYSKDNLSGFSSLAENVVGDKSSPAGTDEAVTGYDVEAVTLNKLVERKFDTLPDSVVLKVDVEGFEGPVLRGAQQLLEQTSWWRAIVEFSAKSLHRRGADPRQAWQWLRRHSGFILQESLDAEFPKLQKLDDSLPESAPAHCNIVIGDGAVR